MNNIPLVCPCQLKHELSMAKDKYLCANEECEHHDEELGFPIINCIPVLIRESRTDTVCSRVADKKYVDRSRFNLEFLKKFIIGESKTTKLNCRKFIDELIKVCDKPKVLVIGGGARGAGTDDLWSHPGVQIHSVDIYASSTVDVVCDGHYLPLDSDYYDGVWIQAVLEHVVEPQKVVSEIYRVLKSGGLVYAETPFMQQVHEGAYDFTRFTVLGHRYLFKEFEMIKIGGNKGPELVLVWALRYFIWSLTRSRKIARLVGLGFGLLMRPFASLMSKASMYDASSGVFFLGRKSESRSTVSHKDLISLYKGQF